MNLKKDMICFIGVAALFSMLNGCAIAPSTIVKQPLTAKPVENEASKPTPGAIYNAATSRHLFEDRKARMVGDILTVNVVENTNASKDASSSASKSGSIETAIASYMGKPIPKASFSAGGDLGYEDESAEVAGNRFNGSITATVVEVLSNGNLVVSGEKQVSLDKGTEYVRFSGVVNPDNITIGNNITSNKIADARIEYRTGSKLDPAQIAGVLARFFLSIGPI